MRLDVFVSAFFVLFIYYFTVLLKNRRFKCSAVYSSLLFVILFYRGVSETRETD